MEERLGKKPVKINIPADLPLIPLDIALFGQVLVNLIDNAIKFSPPDTPIIIDVAQSKNDINIQIKDQGIGIPNDDLDRVFNKFYRVSRPENISGTGLGLAICKGIIEAHGGFIHAENRPDGGTIIIINLPKEKNDQ